MKATELMVGDWVKIKGLKDPVKRISCIDEYVRTVDFWDDEGVMVTSIDKVLPIPLTKEILEKNGFEELMSESEISAERFGRKPEHTGVWQYGFGWFGSVSYVPERSFLCVKFMEGHTADIANIKYVHELQHALRLCGVEKEIIL